MSRFRTFLWILHYVAYRVLSVLEWHHRAPTHQRVEMGDQGLRGSRFGSH